MATILLVDDSQEIRASLRAALEMHGYTVLEAAYLMGVQAMATGNSDVKCVVLDGNVPLSYGLSPISSIGLALTLKQQGVNVIFHSADSDLCGLARKEGLTAVEKGSGIQELLEAIGDD